MRSRRNWSRVFQDLNSSCRLFKRDDISNIFINPDGSLRIQKKGVKGYEVMKDGITAC